VGQVRHLRDHQHLVQQAMQKSPTQALLPGVDRRLWGDPFIRIERGLWPRHQLDRVQQRPTLAPGCSELTATGGRAAGLIALGADDEPDR